MFGLDCCVTATGHSETVPPSKVRNSIGGGQKRTVRCDRDRTCDPLIKSQLLYQLSYAPVRPAKPEVAADIAIALHPVQPQTGRFWNPTWVAPKRLRKNQAI